jgi:hypothetical protein
VADWRHAQPIHIGPVIRSDLPLLFLRHHAYDAVSTHTPMRLDSQELSVRASEIARRELPKSGFRLSVMVSPDWGQFLRV